MSPLVVATCAVSVVAAAAYIVRRTRANDVPAAFLKACASVCFVALGLVSAALGARTEAALVVVMALVLCLVGDVFLSVNAAGSGTGAGLASGPASGDAGAAAQGGAARGSAPTRTLWTYGGFVAFMLGHLCLTGFMLADDAWSLLPAAILVGVVGGTFIYQTPRILGLRLGRIRLLTACYSAVIFTATALAVLRAAFQGGVGATLFAVGYVLFLLSDIVLAAIMFTDGRNTPRYNVLNLVPYYAGQNLIALSLLWL